MNDNGSTIHQIVSKGTNTVFTNTFSSTSAQLLRSYVKTTKINLALKCGFLLSVLGLSLVLVTLCA